MWNVFSTTRPKGQKMLKGVIITWIIFPCVVFALVYLRTGDLDVSLFIAIAVFLSYLSWVIVYYRNPKR